MMRKLSMSKSSRAKVPEEKNGIIGENGASLQVFLPDNRKCTIPVSTYTTGAQAVEQLASQLSVKNKAALIDEFCLWRCSLESGKMESALSDQDYLIHELNKTVQKKGGSVTKYKYALRRKKYTRELPKQEDLALLRLIIGEAQARVMAGEIAIPETNILLQLAALSIRLKHGKNIGDTDTEKTAFMMAKMDNFVPQGSLYPKGKQATKDSWASRLLMEYLQIEDLKDAALTVLSALQTEVPSYGCATFPCMQEVTKGAEVQSSKACLGVRTDGIILLSPDRKTKVQGIRINQVASMRLVGTSGKRAKVDLIFFPTGSRDKTDKLRVEVPKGDASSVLKMVDSYRDEWDEANRPDTGRFSAPQKVNAPPPGNPPSEGETKTSRKSKKTSRNDTSGSKSARSDDVDNSALMSMSSGSVPRIIIQHLFGGEHSDVLAWYRPDCSVDAVPEAAACKSFLPLSFEFIQTFRGSPHVKQLDLSTSQATDAWVNIIKGFPNLQYLSLKNTDIVTLVRQGPPVSLRALNLSGCKITAKEVSLLAGSKLALCSLNIDNIKMASAAWSQLMKSPMKNSLTHLSASNCSLDNKSMTAICEGFKEIKCFDVSRNRNLSDDGGRAMMYLTRLLTVDVRETRISKQTIKELVGALACDAIDSDGKDRNSMNTPRLKNTTSLIQPTTALKSLDTDKLEEPPLTSKSKGGKTRRKTGRKEQKQSNLSSSNVFGVPLDEIPLQQEIPVVVFACLKMLMNKGAIGNIKGIFESFPKNQATQKIREKFESAKSRTTVIDLKGCNPEHVAQVLAQYINELPEPLIPTAQQSAFMKCKKVSEMTKLVEVLPRRNRSLLQHFSWICSSQIIPMENVNEMELSRLSRAVAAIMFQKHGGDVGKGEHFAAMRKVIGDWDSVFRVFAFEPLDFTNLEESKYF